MATQPDPAALRYLLLGLAALMVACAGSSGERERPARLLPPSDAARAELRAVVAAAIGQADVRLAEDALQQDGVLLLERKPRSDPMGHRVPGRDLGAPSRFQLFIADDRCLLRHAESDRSWPLEQARCVGL